MHFRLEKWLRYANPIFEITDGGLEENGAIALGERIAVGCQGSAVPSERNNSIRYVIRGQRLITQTEPGSSQFRFHFVESSFELGCPFYLTHGRSFMGDVVLSFAFLWG
jgi:hypothetical protein